MYEYFLISILFLAIVFIVLIFNMLSIKFADPNYYNSLNKPSYTPSETTFKIIWYFLYLLLAAAGVFIWKVKGIKIGEISLHFWSISLFFNMIWGFLFFFLKKPLIALIDGLLVWIFTLLCIIVAFQVTVVAGILLIPYIIWLSYELFLNYKIVVMNRNIQ